MTSKNKVEITFIRDKFIVPIDIEGEEFMALFLSKNFGYMTIGPF